MKLQTIFLTTIIACGTLAAKSQQKDISGTWLGKLTLGEKQLRIIFHFQKNDKGVYSGTFDSPEEKKVKIEAKTEDLSQMVSDSLDANIKDVPLDSIIIKGNTLLLFGLQIPQAIYRGYIETDSTVKGKWGFENGGSQLNIKRVDQESIRSLDACITRRNNYNGFVRHEPRL